MQGSQWMRMILVAITLAWSLPVVAQDCNVKIYDPGSRLGQGSGDVSNAMDRLATLGADVRVIVVGTVPSGGEAYLNGIKSRCSEWQSSDGDYRNNIIAVLVAVDGHDLSIIYGGGYTRALDGRVDDIRADRMNPRFRDGDIAGGIKDGLDAIATNISLGRTVIPNGSGPVTVNVEAPSQPVDLTGLWWVLCGLVIALALAGVVIAFRNLMRGLERRKAAQAAAKTEKGKCVQEVLSIGEPVAVLKARIGMLARKVSENDLADVTNKLSALELFRDQAIRANAALDQLASNPDVDGLSPQEYDRITAEYKSVLGRFHQVRSLTSNLEAAYVEIERKANNAPQRILETEEKVDTAKKAVDAFAAKGFKPALASAKWDVAVGMLQNAKKLIGEKQFIAADGACNTAQAGCTLVDQIIADFEETKTLVETDIVAAAARVITVADEISKAKPVFTAIAAEHPENAWASVTGNGSEAEKRVVAAKQSLDVARTASSMEKQEWEAAKESIAQAVTFLDQASSLMRSIHALKQNLDIAKRDSAKEIDDAQADIDSASKYIKMYDADIRDSHWDELRDVTSTLGEARTLLRETKPDYLRILAIAKAANAVADSILVNATGEHDEADRIRRRDVSARRDAVAACSAAKEYNEDHSSDVGLGAVSELKTAKRLMVDAEKIENIIDRTQANDNAKKQADSALKSAQNDVHVAEEEREAERARKRREREREADEARRSARRHQTSSSSSTDFGGWGSSSSSHHSGGSSGGFGSSSSGSSSGGFGSSSHGSSSGKW